MLRLFLTIFIIFSFSVFSAELHQINEKKDGFFVLDDGSVWKHNEMYDGAVHINESQANDPQGLEQGDAVVVYKWYPNSTSWQVFDSQGKEIEHPADLFVFHGDGLHYMTLIHEPKDQKITDINLDARTVSVNGQTYQIRAHPRQIDEMKMLWKSGDPVIIAADSELTGEPNPKPVIVNVKNNAVLKTK